jgi:hypothetical protein
MLLALLFFLIAAHALMDYSLQNDSMAVCKCPKSTSPLAAAVPWYYWLTSHALLHGAAVGVIFRWMGFTWDVVALVAMAETVIHWYVDFGKCAKWYSLHTDQALHVVCKIAWWALVAAKALEPGVALF